MIKENNYFPKVLITSPSINSNQNIGGISNFAKLLIENNSFIDYLLFIRGTKDFQKKRLLWLLKQPFVFLHFIHLLIKEKKIEIIHVNMPLEKNAIPRDLLFVFFGVCFNKKIILHLHGGMYNLKKQIPFFLKYLLLAAFRLSNKIITLGEREKEYLIYSFDQNPQKIVVIPSAVKIPTTTIIKNNSDLITILYIGRIDKNKGLKEIISALELLLEKYNFNFIIAGSGPDKESFIDECQNRIPKNYEYKGVIFGEEKHMVLKKSNIFLMPSYFEGLPYALLEAMSNMLVPIVTPVGAIPEIIVNGKNGFLVPIHDHKLIVEIIKKMIQDPKQMQSIGENALSTIKSKYSISDYIININQTYLNLKNSL